jgi:hypothetical protein
MQEWDIQRYSRPFLAIDELSRDASAVLLRRSGESYEIAAQGAGPGVAEIARVLAALRNPSAPLWREARADAENPWRPMLAQLDRIGLVEETERRLPETAAREAEALEQDARLTVRWLVAAARNLPRGEIQLRAAELYRFGWRLLRHGPGRPRRTISRNFHRDVLMRQMLYWERGAPLSLAAAVLALHQVLQAWRAPVGDGVEALARLALRSHCGSIYEPADVRMHLQSLACLLALSSTPGSRRICPLPPAPERWRSGVNLMLDGERLVAHSLERLGESRFTEAVRSARLSRRVAAGVYLEQYHLSRRFVEILAPVMRRRLRAGLRERVFQYYSEEVGHEEFEREAALAVGVAEAELRRSMPLPLFTAYLDLFTDLAEHDPIGFLLSILITEGFPGTRTPINEALERSGHAVRSEAVRKHEELNVDLHHSTIPRLMLAEVPAVDPASQQVALANLVTLVELNSRAWSMLYAYYGSEELPFPHVWLSVPPAKMPSLFAEA